MAAEVVLFLTWHDYLQVRVHWKKKHICHISGQQQKAVDSVTIHFWVCAAVYQYWYYLNRAVNHQEHFQKYICVCISMCVSTYIQALILTHLFMHDSF